MKLKNIPLAHVNTTSTYFTAWSHHMSIEDIAFAILQVWLNVIRTKQAQAWRQDPDSFGMIMHLVVAWYCIRSSQTLCTSYCDKKEITLRVNGKENAAAPLWNTLMISLLNDAEQKVWAIIDWDTHGNSCIFMCANYKEAACYISHPNWFWSPGVFSFPDAINVSHPHCSDLPVRHHLYFI